MRRFRRELIWSLAVLSGTFGFIYAGWRLLFDHAGGYIVYARFTDAQGLRPNFNVKIGGLPAGIVVGQTLTPDDQAVLKLRLDSTAAPIGAGATAWIRPVNLLGEMYVDLTPGDASRPQPSGSTIPLSRTGESVQLDSILNMLDPNTRGMMQILITEAGIALDGRGADFNSLLHSLPPALDQLRGTISQVSSDNATLGRLIDDGDQVLQSTAAGRNDLGQLVAST